MVFEIWENFTGDGIYNYAMRAYASMDPWLWPLVFLGIFGFIYAATQSIVVLVVGIFLVFGVLAATTDIFSVVPEPTLIAYVIAVIGIAMLLTAVFLKLSRKF